MPEPWWLYLDDLRSPTDTGFRIARNIEQAKQLVLNLGMPDYMALDHDLGNDETVMDFLKWLAFEYWDEQPVPGYSVHSDNPVGKQNIVAFMESWHKVQPT